MTYKELFEKSKLNFELDDKTINYVMKYHLNLSDAQFSKIELDDEKINSYFNKLDEIKNGQPIQYVVGNVDFYGYNFEVRHGVLIPRFETEQLVYNTKKYINKYFNGQAKLIDVGTGSGIIGLTLKKEVPLLDVTLTDISSRALDLATTNASRLGVNATIYQSNMLEEVIKRGLKYDVIVSNPPYLTKNEEIMDIVKNNEPELALYGGDDGLKYYRIILESAKSILNHKALIAFEIGANQSDDLIALTNYYFQGMPYEVQKDLTGRDRMFFIFYNLND